MKTGNYLSSARTMTILALTILPVTVDLARKHAEHARTFSSVQRTLAEYLIGEHLREVGQTDLTSVKLEDVAAKLPHGGRHVHGLGRVTISVQADPPGRVAREFDGPPGPFLFRVECQSQRGRDWQFSMSPESIIDKGDLVGRAREKVAQTSVALAKEDDVVDIYARLEDQLFTKEVDLLLVGFSVRPRVAIWVLALALAILSIKARQRLRTVLQDRSVADEEPWIILDARSPLEKLIGVAWLGGLLLSGPIVSGCLVMTVTSLGRLAPVPSDWAGDAWVVSCVLAVVGLTHWTSLSLVSDLLRLRFARVRAFAKRRLQAKRRAQRARRLGPAVESAPPPGPQADRPKTV